MRNFLFPLLFLLFFNFSSFAQDEIDFEEFMGMLSETVPEDMLDELSYQLPWNIKVSGYAYGDFSMDGTFDFVLAIKVIGKTPPKSVDVYFFENIANKTFRLVKIKNYKYYDVVLEVSFLIKEGKCFVTNRDENNWYFTGYRIDKDKLICVEKEVYPLEFENAGDK